MDKKKLKEEITDKENSEWAENTSVDRKVVIDQYIFMARDQMRFIFQHSPHILVPSVLQCLDPTD